MIWDCIQNLWSIRLEVGLLGLILTNGHSINERSLSRWNRCLVKTCFCLLNWSILRWWANTWKGLWKTATIILSLKIMKKRLMFVKNMSISNCLKALLATSNQVHTWRLWWCVFKALFGVFFNTLLSFLSFKISSFKRHKFVPLAIF